MKTTALTLAAALTALLLPAAPARAADPADILARAKEAAGGKAWDAVHTLHTRARIATGGLAGPAEGWDDLRNGRFADTFDLGPVTGAGGFDGKATWTQDASGQTRVDDSGDAREGSIDEVYRRSLAYWYPGRRKAEISDAGDRAEGERAFHVLRIVPAGGRPFEMWIDARILQRPAAPLRLTHHERRGEVRPDRDGRKLRGQSGGRRGEVPAPGGEDPRLRDRP